MLLTESFTYKAFRDTVLKHLERFSTNGRENAVGEVTDIEKRLPEILNLRLRALYDEYGVGRSLAKLPVGRLSLIYYGEDFYVDGEESVMLPKSFKRLAYRIVASGNASIQILGCADSKAHRIGTADGEYIQLSGIIGESLEEPTMLLVGLPTLHVRSLEIIEVPDFADDFIPLDTDTFDRIAMLPVNTSRIIGIMNKYGERLSESDFKIYPEYGVITLFSPCDDVLCVDYLESPYTFTEENASDGVIALPPLLFDALCCACAADVCPITDAETAAKLTYRYRELFENIFDRYKDVSAGRNRFYGKIKRRKGCKH